MNQDIVLLTVDSWRYDTTDLVSNLSERLSGPAELICAGAATNWVFPAILSSTYYPNAYDDTGDLRSGLRSLPEMLSEEGYATGGFVACNPYVSKWNDHFDEFWNANLSTDSTEWYSNSIEKWLSRLYRTAFLQKRASAKEVAKRASTWYVEQDGPRFLWMHLMEPHLPYYPGLRRAQDVGLLDSYRSVISYQRHGDETPQRHIDTQRSLYDKCVNLFDECVPNLLDFIDDNSIVVAFGDHGEEFDHGHYDHERLYDECVRVPLYYRNIGIKETDSPLRQIDIAPKILDSIDVSVPTEWDGQKPKSMANHPAMMVTPEPEADLLHTAIRTDSEKLIKSFDRESGNLSRTEYYDLASDSDEQQNLAEEEHYDWLEDRLDDFVAEHESALDMEATTGINSAVVESRLEDLGHK